MTTTPSDLPEPTPGRGAMWASLAGTIFQAVYALVQFVILAALLRYLGGERFGMWSTVWSLGAWAMLTHFGVNHALLTELGRYAAVDRDRAGRLLTSAMVTIGSACVLLAVLAGALGALIPWDRVLNVESPQAVAEAGPVAVTAIVVALLGVPCSMGGAALMAVQRGGESFLIQSGVHLLCMVAVVVGVQQQWALPVLTAIAFSPPIVAGLIQWVRLVTGDSGYPLHRPDMQLIRLLIHLGGIFFVMELLGIAMMQTGPIIIAQRLGANAVTPYAGMFRLVGLMLALFSVLMLAYWPAFADAGGRKDLRWFRSALGLSLAKTMLVWLVGAVGIMVVGDGFIHWWLGPEAIPTFALKLWMVLFAGAQGLYLWLTTPLKGIGALAVQVVSGGAMALVFIALAVWLCDRYGAAGVPMAQTVAIVTIGLPLNALALWRILRDGRLSEGHDG